MIFSHLYFCHTLKMSPQDTSNYLEFLFQLEEPQKSFAKKNEALAWLERQEDSLLQAYAVPILIEGILAESGRVQTIESENNQAHTIQKGKEWERQIFLLKSKKLISGLLETGQPIPRAKECLNLIQNMDETEYKDMVDNVLELPSMEPDHEYQFSYLESDECAYPIILLSILRAIAKDDPAMVAEVLAEKKSKLLDTALDTQNGLGLLPWKLALDLKCYCGMSFDEAVKYFPEYWMDSAECLEITAHIFLEDYKTSEKTRSGSVEKLIEESRSLTFFCRYRNRIPDTVWIDEKADYPNRFKICAVLWQNILWNTAYEYHASACTKQLKILWNAPVYGSPRQTGSNNSWRNILIPNGARVPDSKQYPDYLICTPWQRRTIPKSRDKQSKNPCPEFKDITHNASAFRVFAAAVMLRRMIGEREQFPIEYCRILLNMGDVFQNHTVALELSEDPKYWEGAVLRLGYFAKNCIRMLGRGELNSKIPRQIITVINEGRENKRNNEQLNLQYQITGLQVCIHWAAESLRAGSIRQGGIIENPWFLGGQESGAVQLCKYFFGNEINQADFDYREPAMLCYQAFTETYRNIVSDRHSWIAKYYGSSGLITLCDILLSSELSLEDWESLGTLRRERFEKEVWLSVLTLRLGSLLASSRIQDYESWYTEWRDGIASYVSDKDAYGILFYQMAEILTIRFSENGIPWYYPDIIKLVIGTIHNYTSEETIFYQYVLTEKLTNAWEYFGVKTGADAISQNLIEIYSKRESAKEQALLEYSLTQAKRMMPYDVLSEVCRIYTKYWKQQCASRNHHALLHLNPEEWNPLTDFALQKNQAQLNVMRHMQNTERARGRKTVDLFQNPAGAESAGWYVGIITNERGFQNQKKETNYLIRYGAGKREPFKSRAEYHKGEVLGVYLDKMHIQKIGKLAWKDDGKPVSVRLIDLSAETVRLQLPNGEWDSISERMNGKDFHRMLNLWEPDTSRILQRTETENTRELNLEREVYYDEAADFYFPVKRDFNRLVIEHFFKQEQPDLKLRMVFIRELIDDGQRCFLYSTDTGINYLLHEENWEQESFYRLEKKLAEGNYRQGLIIMACLKVENEHLVLALAGEMPFLEKNWDWENYFTEDEYFVIYRENTEKTSRWYAKIEVADMPDQVAVELPHFQNMGAQTVCNVQLDENGWDAGKQRHRRVKVEMLRARSLKKEWCTPEGFQQLYGLKEGDVLKLENSRLRKQREGYHLMMTDSGLPVFCAAESLSMESESLTSAMISGRACIAELVSCREADEEPYFEALDIPELNECKEQAQGLVSLFTEELNTASAEVNKISLEVWIKQNEEIITIRVPVTAFQNRPRALGVPVLAVRQPDGKWLFRASVRKIQVRALWEAEDHVSERPDSITGIRLGRNMNIPGYGRRLVTQAEDRPVLYLWDENTIQKGGGTAVCGIEPGMGKISKVKRRNFPWDVFPYARHKDMVRLAAAGLEFFGDSNWGEFEDVDKTADWSVGAGIYLVKEQDGVRYYDLRRSFYIRNAQSGSESATDEQNKRLDEQYEKWINEGDYHVIGSKLGDHSFRLESLKVPQTIGEETLRDKWTDHVSFAQDDHPWVLGRHYPQNRMRALLVKKDSVWTASCHEAAPFHVNDELAREFNIVSGDIIRKKLYYAGMDEQNNLRFEWGHGFTFLVSEEDILDEDGNKIGSNLFYGDMIEYFAMLSGGGEYGWHICVDHRAIVRQIEGRIWDDSFGENGIIQLLRIRRDLEKKHIFVDKISVTEQHIRQEAGSFPSWGFYDAPCARLERKSIDALLGEEDYEKETKIIFAQLKPEKDRKRVTCLTFTYIPLDGKEGDTWLLEGQTVCMVAGEIVPTGFSTRQHNKLSNDYKISLYLPKELPHEKEKPRMCVNVLRREFSVNESKLRTLYPEYARKYYGCNMLVRLKSLNGVNRGTNEWLGNVINTPKRAKNSLKEWVMSQGYCLVTLGMEKKQPLAEVAPGIISRIPPEAVQEPYSQGTLAALWLEEDELKVKTVLPGDMKYLPASGRPAELLIMDGTAKNYVKLRQEELVPGSLSRTEWQKADEEMDRHHFTIAGLPQLLVSNRSLLEKKITEPLPRLAYLIKDQKSEAEQNIEIQIQEEKPINAARLSLNEQNEPELNYFSPDKQVKKAAWEHISFMDGMISELAEFVHKGHWHYHDRNAAIYDSETHQLDVVPLPDGKKYEEIILFPDERGKLRYREREFLKYGFSAREVIENGLPEQDGMYPVAGVTENSIWIEIFPGKLLEIPVEYLFAGEKKLPLTGMWVWMLSAGDRVCLCQDEGFAGNQRKLILKDVIFGSRAAFGEKNTIFPIRECLEDGLILGTELWPVTLPVKGGEWTEQKFVCISRNNTIRPLRNSQILMKGDVLLVSCYKNRMSVSGWESLKIKTAKREFWKNAEWLLDDLLSKDGKKWMRDSALSLPMQVNNSRTENGELCAWVFYHQPDMESLPPETLLSCICVGLRPDKKGAEEVQEIIVRTGRALLRIPAGHILPGLDKKKTVAAVTLLCRKRISFWIHKEEDGWYSGLRQSQKQEQSEIRMLFHVERANGILCLTLDTLALRWLPAPKASRAGRRIDGSVLWNVLCERPERLARHLGQGTLSLTETWQNEQKYEILRPDGTRYRATPMEKASTDDKGIHCYLAELYPFGDLICLYSETEYDCTRREPIPIEIENKHAECITAYPYGMRRKSLHLTPWVYRAFGKASDSDSSGRFDELNLSRFRQEIPKCFDRYRQIPGQADSDAEAGKLDYELLQDHQRTQEQLIYLYSLISKQRNGKLNFNEIYEFIRLTLKAWLEEQGKYLVSGFDPKEKKKAGYLEQAAAFGQKDTGGQADITGQIDAAPAIAAILLMNSVKGRTGDDRLEKTAKPLSVHLTRMLGISCGSSIHQEILLQQWILGNEKTAGLWLRLKQLSLRGEDIAGQASEVFDGQLTPNQVRQLLNICSSLRIHTFWDHELELVAESILLSIGSLEYCDKFYENIHNKRYITEKMSVIGRILTPSAGSDIAEDNLSKDDIYSLRSLLLQLLRKDSVPLSLVTDTQIPISDMEKKRGTDLCDKFCRLAGPYKKNFFENGRSYK